MRSIFKPARAPSRQPKNQRSHRRQKLWPQLSQVIFGGNSGNSRWINAHTYIYYPCRGPQAINIVHIMLFACFAVQLQTFNFWSRMMAKMVRMRNPSWTQGNWIHELVKFHKFQSYKLTSSKQYRLKRSLGKHQICPRIQSVLAIAQHNFQKKRSTSVSKWQDLKKDALSRISEVAKKYAELVPPGDIEKRSLET